jgi:hypothetical protein
MEGMEGLTMYLWCSICGDTLERCDGDKCEHKLKVGDKIYCLDEQPEDGWGRHYCSKKCRETAFTLAIIKQENIAERR